MQKTPIKWALGVTAIIALSAPGIFWNFHQNRIRPPADIPVAHKPTPGKANAVAARTAAHVQTAETTAKDLQTDKNPNPPGRDATGTPEQSLAKTDWWATVYKNIQSEEYQIRCRPTNDIPTDAVETCNAPNRAQNLRTVFTSGGVGLFRRTETVPTWQAWLHVTDAGRAGQTSPLPGDDAPRVAGPRIEYDRGWIKEWYTNRPEGLEQGFDILEKPTGKGWLAIAMQVTGDTIPVLAEQGTAIDFFTPSNVRVLRYSKLQVVDATDRILPSRIELADNTIRVMADDSTAVYPVYVDPLVTSPSWTAESDQVDAWFGESINSAGDVNGDGFNDLIVGAKYYDNGEAREGGAFVFYGSAAGLSTTIGWMAEGNQAQAWLGCSVGTAGDVNGDGYADVIIGACQYGTSQEGAAFVFHGSATGLDPDPGGASARPIGNPANADWQAASDLAYGEFGHSVGTAGNLYNADGTDCDDIIIGARSYTDNPGTEDNEGHVFVYYGNPSGLGPIGTPANADWTAQGNKASARFGAAVGTAGDVNGDGYSDIIIGAPLFNSVSGGEGAAFVYHGGLSGPGSPGTPGNADWMVINTDSGAYYGNSAASAGDVNGDGYGDVIVGANVPGKTAAGDVYVYHGTPGGLVTSHAWTAAGDQVGMQFGIAVNTAGDVNGDGYSDIIVGASSAANGETEEGAAYVYHGSSNGLALPGDTRLTGNPGNADWFGESNQAEAYYGISAATAGDVNGDGFSDIVVGSYRYTNGESNEGRAFVYYGARSNLSADHDWIAAGDNPYAGPHFGCSVNSAGDVNGDGYGDIIVGAYMFSIFWGEEGKIYVFYGNDQGLPVEADWTAEGSGFAQWIGFDAGNAGDVNGDGYGDIIVGSKLGNAPTMVFHGSETGLDKNGTRPSGTFSNADWQAQGDTAGDSYGHVVATAGDVNGDGYSDIIIGAPDFEEGEANEGCVFVYQGAVDGLGPDGTSQNYDWRGQGNQIGALFGSASGTAGDVNGDGYSDIIVGAKYFDNGEANEGAAFVFLGSQAGLGPEGHPGNADWQANGDQDYAYFGWSVGTAGDVNGDGYSDIIVGAPDYLGSDENDVIGEAFVYHGGAGGLSTTADWTAQLSKAYTGTTGITDIGSTVSTAGDVNGDGYSDVVIGAPGANGENNLGMIFLYTGSIAGLETDWSWKATENLKPVPFGTRVGTVGDVNADGFSDIIVGVSGYDGGQTNQGAVYVYYGNGGVGTNVRLRQFHPDATTRIYRLGASASETAFNVSALGRTPAGTGKIKLEWEVKPVGQPFDGLGTGLSPYMDTAIIDLGGRTIAGHTFNEPVTGLVGHTAYHWQARFHYKPGNPMGLVKSRWFSPYPGQLAHLRTANTAPSGGYTAAHVIPTNDNQIRQASDGSGQVAIDFRIQDPGVNLCTLHTFEYSTDSGSTWSAPTNGDSSGSLQNSWVDNNGALYASATDWSGSVYSFTFDTRHADVTGMDSVDQSDVMIRFTVNDGLVDSAQPVASEPFNVDNQPPATGTVTIADTLEYGYTSDPTPDLDINSTDAVSMRFALSEGSLAGATWIPYAAAYTDFDISTGGDGAKTVWVEFRDDVGNIQTVHASDTTIYDTLPPPVAEGSIIIVDSEGYTKDSTPEVQLFAEGAFQMRFASVANGFIDNWASYTPSHSGFDISAGGDGEKTIWVQFRDQAGNKSIPTADQTIYDTTPPNPGTIVIDYEYCVDCGGAGEVRYTSAATPTIYITGTAADSMRFEVSDTEPTPFTSGWNPFAATYNFIDISGGEGLKTVWAEFKDRLDNVQQTHASASIYYDPAPPVSTIVSVPAFSTAGIIPISWSADDGSGSGVADTILYYKREAGTFWKNASLSGTSSPFNFTDLSGDGDYYFVLVSEDNLGNREIGPPEITDPGNLPTGVTHVLYETAAPESQVTHVALNDATAEFTVTYTYSDTVGAFASDVAQVELWVKGPDDTVYSLVYTDTPANGEFVYQATSEGAYHFYTIATDNAGNVEEIPTPGYDMMAIYSSEFSGYAILAVGSIAGGEGLEAHTQTANHIYAHLINRNFALVDDPVQRWDDPLDLIKYFNPYSEPQPGEDDYSNGGTVSYWDALRKSITEWALEKMTVRSGPLYLILVDHGTPDNFHLTGTQNITPSRLDEWIDSLEADMASEGIDEDIIIVLGTCYSGSFIDELSKPGTRRIIVASAAENEPSYRGPQEPGGVRDGEFFISSLFNSLGQGFDLNTSFTRAVQLTEVHTDSGLANSPPPYHDSARQHALLDDDGDGFGSNDLSGSGDGFIAAGIELGFGIDADIVQIDPDNFGSDLTAPLGVGEETATLWANVIDDPAKAPNAEQVWVEIRFPGIILQQGTEQQTVDLVEVPLVWNIGNQRYEAEYVAFDTPGRYTLFFYVKDDAGITSSFERTFVYKASTDPNLPPEDFSLQIPANNIPDLNATTGIAFGWSPVSDTDGDSVTYTLEIRSGNWETAILVYRVDGLPRNGVVIPSNLPDYFTDQSTYTWRVTAVDQYGNQTYSDIWGFTVDNENGVEIPLPFEGYVKNIADPTIPVVNAEIQTVPVLGVSSTDFNGWFMGTATTGANYVFTVSAAGYESIVSPSISFPRPAADPYVIFYLTPSPIDSRGDVNGDEAVDLADAVVALQVTVGLNPAGVSAAADVNGDGRIGIEEFIFILQEIAGLRN